MQMHDTMQPKWTMTGRVSKIVVFMTLANVIYLYAYRAGPNVGQGLMTMLYAMYLCDYCMCMCLFVICIMYVGWGGARCQAEPDAR